MISSLKELEVITLFADDLQATKEFYQKVFGLALICEDEVSALYKFGALMINLLQASEAPELIEPAPVATAASGSRFMLTINVSDVDAVCAELEKLGVKLLNGPIDRPWGRRTAAFADPSGNAWEIAQELK